MIAASWAAKDRAKYETDVALAKKLRDVYDTNMTLARKFGDRKCRVLFTHGDLCIITS